MRCETYRDLPVGVIEDFVPMNLNRQPELVEAVQEIIATCDEFGVSTTAGRARRWSWYLYT